MHCISCNIFAKQESALHYFLPVVTNTWTGSWPSPCPWVRSPAKGATAELWFCEPQRMSLLQVGKSTLGMYSTPRYSLKSCTIQLEPLYLLLTLNSAVNSKGKIILFKATSRVRNNSNTILYSGKSLCYLPHLLRRLISFPRQILHLVAVLDCEFSHNSRL